MREVEIGTGGYSPAPHRASLTELEQSGFTLAALNVSGNPLEDADHDLVLHSTIELAAELGVERVVCMSGGRAHLAGAGWFPGLEDDTERYWTERVLPYWEATAEFAHRVDDRLRLCFELEPGSAVYNVSTFERLAALGDNIAVNLDPSHFFWQSIDPLEVVRRLGGRIGYAHGKDTVLDTERLALDGVLDRTAWRYATVGHGHDVEWWRAFSSELAAAGYDGPVSIEYEDPTVPPEQSIAESARVLTAVEVVA